MWLQLDWVTCVFCFEHNTIRYPFLQTCFNVILIHSYSLLICTLGQVFSHRSTNGKKNCEVTKFQNFDSTIMPSQSTTRNFSIFGAHLKHIRFSLSYTLKISYILKEGHFLMKCSSVQIYQGETIVLCSVKPSNNGVTKMQAPPQLLPLVVPLFW
jgi:hypothetical protein